VFVPSISFLVLPAFYQLGNRTPCTSSWGCGDEDCPAQCFWFCVSAPVYWDTTSGL